jgi:transcription antitermination factor NusG
MGAKLPPRREYAPGGCTTHSAAESDLLDVLDPAGDGERWTVLYTHSNCERLLQRACDRSAIRHYLPIVEQWSGPDRARRRAAAPLFPSYVFACLSHAQRLHVLEVGHVARVIPVAHPDLLLAELRQIREAIAGGGTLSVGPALERGAWVRVVHGPLAGVVGRVEGLRRRKRRHRLVMNVSMLGRGVSTEVDASEVERVEVPGDKTLELLAEGMLT